MGRRGKEGANGMVRISYKDGNKTGAQQINVFLTPLCAYSLLPFHTLPESNSRGPSSTGLSPTNSALLGHQVFLLPVPATTNTAKQL